MRYEPYGTTLMPADQGPGYAGHVTDAATGLSYMQQRYYDPMAGRFLSTDPVAANVGGFSRYWYANNNPYKNIDPDGRESREFNWENRMLGLTPPPRAEGDWMGPAIGGALGAVMTPAAVVGGYEVVMAALFNPVVANNIAVGAIDLLPLMLPVVHR